MIYLPRSRYVAVVGNNIRWNCTFGQMLPKISAVWWTILKNGHHSQFPDSGQKKYHGGAFKSISIEILNVTERNSGEYWCNGENTYGHSYVATQLVIGSK